MQIYVPVKADGFVVRDNGGDAIMNCATPDIAAHVASLINAHSGCGLTRSISKGLRIF